MDIALKNIIMVRHLILVVMILLSTSKLVQVGAVKKLTILHVNDMHSRFEQTNLNSGVCSPKDVKDNACYGGYARLVTSMNNQKKVAESNGRSVIIMNAGDIFQGTIYYYFFKAGIVSNLTNQLPFDVSCLGNHEFDDGPDVLSQFVNATKFPLVSSNINVTGEPSLKSASNLKKSTVINVGGLKVGVVGYLTPDTLKISNPKNVEIYDEIPHVQKETNRLRNEEGAQVVIALGHSGFDMDMKIAKKVEGVDVVIGGHSNTFLYTGKQPSVEVPYGPYPYMIKGVGNKDVPVVQAFAYTKYLGVLNVDFTDEGMFINASGNALLLDHTINEDTNMVDLIEPYKNEVGKLGNVDIGITRVFLDGSLNIRKEESNLGNLIADSYVDYYLLNEFKSSENNTSWTDTSIALIQAGGIRSSINATSTNGIIKSQDVSMVLPFTNQLTRIGLKGSVLKEAFEWSISTYVENSPSYEGGFLQVSGILVEYDTSKEKGNRVISLKAKCSKCHIPTYYHVNDDEVYNVLMSNYLANGGDFFTMFKEKRKYIEILDIQDSLVFSDYVKRKSPVYPGLEGRISFITSASVSLFTTPLIGLIIRTILIHYCIL